MGESLLLGILHFFQNLTGSYGLAIIFLTVLVRLALYPLSQKQMDSMAQMQKIQPRMKMLQEKYKDDKQKLNEEIMRLYKENNANPMAGCLPILVQLPIMFILFQVLMNNEEAVNQVFMLIRLDKSVLYGFAEALSVLPADASQVGIFQVMSGIAANPSGLLHVGLYLPSTILTIVICFLMWYQQRISGAASNPQMASMNVMMPLIMGFFCLSLPGGVLVYWGTSSLIGIAQQWFVMKRTKAVAAVKPTLYKNKPVPGGTKNQVMEEEAADEDEYEDDDEYEDEDYDDDEYEYEDEDEDEGKGR
ncbi:MAG: YidC/Oxa1 family membrane protein insertase [Synergistaceae bacterium]|jgi:YidC/Oxa1 family membrane protein insertase|nr:YidC/Oxa1 family membrane protein insertase [Synergistaceae bacterium]